MYHIKIINGGDRTRTRVGHTFKPGVTADLQVDKHGLLALQATRGFSVQLADDQQDDGAADDGQALVDDTVATAVDGMTAKEVLDAVETGVLDGPAVYLAESVGKQRSTILSELQPAGDDEQDTTNDEQ